MITFHIEKPDEAIAPALEDKINNLGKPKGSLGRLEELAFQIGLIQQTLTPTLLHPVNVIYAADHGISDEHVSQSPKEVTRQVIYNFLNGGSGVCFLARQHGFDIKIVDGGVDYDFPEIPGLINRKIRKGTRNYLHEAAMTTEEVDLAIRYGADAKRVFAGARRVHVKRCRLHLHGKHAHLLPIERVSGIVIEVVA